MADDDTHLSQIATRWSLLWEANGNDPAHRSAARGELLLRYVAPVYRYLRAVVRDSARAEDLCQEFALRFLRGDFRHADPTGAQKGTDNMNANQVLYTAGDLAATMAVNVNLKVLSLNGYFDSVTPFYQTANDLKNMPLLDADIRKHNLTIRNYPCGHMTYLDGKSRTAMKADLATFYDSAVAPVSVSHSYRWLPPRIDGLPRRHGLWVYKAGIGYR